MEFFAQIGCADAADEHYLSTLLAYHSQDLHTDCLGLLANSTWRSADPETPRTRLHEATIPAPMPAHIRPDVLLAMRRPNMRCQGNLAIYSAARTFGTFLDAYAPGLVEFDARALHFECPLFGEGFGTDVAPGLLQLMTSPAGRHALQILPASQAQPSTGRQEVRRLADPAAERSAHAAASQEHKHT